MADPIAPPTPAPTADERLARLEVRVAEIERRLAPPTTGLSSTPERGGRTVGPLMPLEELYRMQLEAGADPDGTWAREEIERMREE